MSMKKSVKVAVLIGISIVFGCASSYPYRYYAYDRAADVLLGETEADDLPASICDARGPDKINCIVYRLDEHAKLKADYRKAITELQRCRRRIR